MIIPDGFSNPLIGHVLSSVQAIYPSSNTMTQRLNSLESRIILQTTEEGVEDSVCIFDFGALIHDSPFKTPIKWTIPNPKRTSLARSANANPRASASANGRTSLSSSQVSKKVLPFDPSSGASGGTGGGFQSSRLKSFSSMRSMGSNDGRTPKSGILKKGTRSRFANQDRQNTFQSEGSMSRVTIVE